MANYTIDADIAVEATSADFPLVFPYFFGPTASLSLAALADGSLSCTALAAANEASDSLDAVLDITTTFGAEASLSGVMSAPRPIMVVFDIFGGLAYHADASLSASTSTPFPYTFPFTFGATGDTIGLGQPLSADLSGTITSDVTGTRNQFADANQDLTASFNVLMLEGGNHAVDAQLTTTTTPDTVISRGQMIDTSLQVGAVLVNNIAWEAFAQATLNVVAAQDDNLQFDASISSVLPAALAVPAQANISALMNSSFQAIVFLSESSQKHRYVATNLLIDTDISAGIAHNVIVNAELSISVSHEVTFPEATGFWDFFLR